MAALAGGAAVAQEAIVTPAATQPSTGHAVLREQVRWYRAERFPDGSGVDAVDELRFDTSLQLGLRQDLSVTVEQPAMLQWQDLSGGGTQTSEDLGDLRAFAKWRFHRRDTGPIDTERASAIVGMQFDTGSGSSLRPGFARGSNDPIVGAVYTRVMGRHGTNAALLATLSTAGRADEFDYGANWLFRVAPASYSATDTGAAYAVVELNGVYETNGDHELRIAPGFMYEAQRWTLELSVQLPLAHELDHRAEVDIGVVLGFRLLF